MRLEFKATLAVAALAIAGCYSNHTFIGMDSSSDTSVDTGHDTGHDTGFDTGHDTAVDMWPDTVPDVPHDIWPDGTEICPPPSPPPDGPMVAFSLDDEPTPGWVDISEPCTVESMEYWDEDTTVIHLGCTTPSGEIRMRTLSIYAWPTIYVPLWEGYEVHFRYVATNDWWTSRWFTFSYIEGLSYLIFGGFDADDPNPPIYENLWEPLSLVPVGGYCPLTRSDCFDVERQALVVMRGEERTLVFDSTQGWVGEWGEFGIHLDAAEGYSNFRCTDVPSAHYAGLIVQNMWD
jgi:hypothetical protein